MSGVITTGNHPKALWPGVKEWWGRAYTAHPEEWKQLVDVETSSMNYEEDVQITGFGLVPVKAQGSSTSYDSETQGFTTRYTHVTYSLGYVVTQEELADNLYEEVSKTRASALAFSFQQTKENVVSNMYNRAFNSSYTFGDGKELLATDHPHTSGGTWSNELAVAADLSEASLEDIIIQMGGAVDDRGLLIALMPKKLIVPRQLGFEAARILKSVQQPGTANNDINVLNAMNSIPEGFVVNHFLTSSGAWFVRANVPMGQGLKFYQRVGISFTQDNDFDTDNAKAKGRERYSVGCTDPRALWGSAAP